MIVTVALIFCGTELSPGWELFGFHWPPAVYYLIMGLAGAFAGVWAWAGYPIPGLLAGPVAATGGLAAVAWYLGRVQQTVDFAVLIAGAIGAIPGFVFFSLLRWLQDCLAPPSTIAEEPGENRSPNQLVDDQE